MRTLWIRSLGVLLGLILVGVGIALLLHPFASVNWLVLLLVVGLAAVALAETLLAFTRRDDTPSWVRGAIAGIAGVLAILVALLPGLTVELLAALAGILPILAGVRDLVLALRRATNAERIPRVLFGIASLVFGVTILAWPDVTVWVLGVLIGVWLGAMGVRIAATALRRDRASAASTRRPRPVLRGVLAGIALLASIAIAATGIHFSSTPVPDEFYSAPADVPATPGSLLKSEPFTRSVPAGATAWRILYTTTGLDDRPAVASALVVVPATGAPHPVIAWTHGTTGVAQGCAPSLLPEPFVSGAMPDLHEVLASGWAVVATDYIGLGTGTKHEYVVGEPAARAALDALRAARQLDGTQLADETVIWGHSQGGHAALWTAGLASTYAPELDLLGVAAMAPATNLPYLLESFATQSLSLLFGAFVLYGYDAAYDDVRLADYVRPSGRIAIDAVAGRCLTDPATTISALEAGLSGGPVWSQNPSSGPLGDRADENVPRLAIDFPVLLAQGLADPLIVPEAQRDYVAERCAAGQAIDFRTYAGKDHMGLVTGDSPLLGELLDWTRDRLADRAPTPNC